MNQDIRLKRGSTIYTSYSSAITALNGLTHKVGQPVLVYYKDSSEATTVKTLLVIGKAEGTGSDKYSIPNPEIFNTTNPGLAPAASNGNKTTAEGSVGNYYLCADAIYRQLPGNAFKDTIPTAYCETAAGTGAKTATCTNYSLSSNSYIPVLIKNSNTSKSALTLNINGKGAKSIYINGSASSSSNYTLPAGSYLVFYDGTKYYFRTDGKITGNITGNSATVNGKTVESNVPSGAVFTDRYVNSAAFADNTSSSSSNPLKMTLTRAGSDSATVTANLPKVSASTAGVTPKGGTVGSQTQSTKFLRHDGTWAVPSYTVDTTYKFTIGSTTNGDSVNGVSLGTLDSEAEAEYGTTLSLVTTGEKYTWNAKQDALNNPVTRSGSTLTNDTIILGSDSSTVKTSGKTISTTAPDTTSDDTTVPTSKAVWDAITEGISINNSMVYKGTIDGGSTDAYGALTPAASKGWTYRVKTTGTIDGISVVAGGILICNTDTAAATTSDYATIAANWDYIGTNLVDTLIVDSTVLTKSTVADILN